MTQATSVPPGRAPIRPVPHREIRNDFGLLSSRPPRRPVVVHGRRQWLAYGRHTAPFGIPLLVPLGPQRGWHY
jgi:hypothetical protein